MVNLLKFYSNPDEFPINLDELIAICIEFRTITDGFRKNSDQYVEMSFISGRFRKNCDPFVEIFTKFDLFHSIPEGFRKNFNQLEIRSIPLDSGRIFALNCHQNLMITILLFNSGRFRSIPDGLLLKSVIQID